MSVALVTGAARGIGAAVCHRLAAGGMRIAAVDLDEADLAACAGPLRGAGTPVLTGALDVRDRAALDGFVGRVEAELGPISAVVPAAGIARSAPTEAMDPAAWQLVLDVDLTGTFHTCAAVAVSSRSRPSRAAAASRGAPTTPRPSGA